MTGTARVRSARAVPVGVPTMERSARLLAGRRGEEFVVQRCHAGAGPTAGRRVPRREDGSSRGGLVVAVALVAALVGLVVGLTVRPGSGNGSPGGEGTALRPLATAVSPGAQGATEPPARNVVLLIGDGMGDSEITIARNYLVGAGGRLALDGLPHVGDYTTYSVQKAHPSRPDYVTDSAASASGWSTGRKTYDGAISVLPGGRAVPTVLELAEKAGYRTGVVTTSELEDATPAAAASHVTSRSCKGPGSMAACPRNAKQNGGKGSIAEQLVASGADVLLGGGKQYFDQTVKAGPYRGKRVTDEARARGFRVVTTAARLAAVPDSGSAPVLGLFARNDLAQAWVGPRPARTGTKAARCRANRDRPSTQPRLVDLTAKALTLLDTRTRDAERGFFLQIEGASIDKRSHAADPCGQIGETAGFDAAVRRVLAYQKAHPDTLVVVTGDHGQAAQLVEAGARTLGYTATLITREDVRMTISYATAKRPAKQLHTGTQIRIGATGPLAERVEGLSNQTHLFTTLRTALGLG